MKTLVSLVVSGCFASVAAFGAIVAKPVAYEQDGVKLTGYLAYDDASSAKRPGVLVVPEWWGVNDYAKSRAKQLAGMGYVAFVADMYGEGKNTGDAKLAGAWSKELYGKPLFASRTRAGLDVLLKSPDVDTSKVAGIGFCFGGSACQALAYDGSPLVAIVSFHGGLLPVPAGVGERMKTKFLMLNGASDPMVKPADIAAFETAATREKIDFQFVNYAGALHAFSNPDATVLAEKNGMTAAIGYQEAASRRSWVAMKSFFDEVFAAPAK